MIDLKNVFQLYKCLICVYMVDLQSLNLLTLGHQSVSLIMEWSYLAGLVFYQHVNTLHVQCTIICAMLKKLECTWSLFSVENVLTINHFTRIVQLLLLQSLTNWHRIGIYQHTTFLPNCSKKLCCLTFLQRTVQKVQIICKLTNYLITH